MSVVGAEMSYQMRRHSKRNRDSGRPARRVGVVTESIIPQKKSMSTERLRIAGLIQGYFPGVELQVIDDILQETGGDANTVFVRSIMFGSGVSSADGPGYFRKLAWEC